MVTADDGGAVKLFAYPAVVEDAAHRTYRGHSSHVTCARFSPDGERVISSGGRDRCVFQYRVWPVEARSRDRRRRDRVAPAGRLGEETLAPALNKSRIYN